MQVITWLLGRDRFPTITEGASHLTGPHWPARRYNEAGKPVPRQCAVCHVGESREAVARARKANESLGGKPSTYCPRCDAHLCIKGPGSDSCFTIFHSSPKYEHLCN